MTFSASSKPKFYRVRHKRSMCWVCVHKQGGWVLSAIYTCMAGKRVVMLGRYLFKIFKIEAACRLNIRDAKAPTSLLCSWNVSRKSVEQAPLKHITFDRPKKTSLTQDNPPTSYKKLLYSKISFFSSFFFRIAGLTF